MTMFKLTLAMLTLAMLTACSDNTNKPAQTDGATPASKTLRIATEGAYPPFNDLAADGTLAVSYTHLTLPTSDLV